MGNSGLGRCWDSTGIYGGKPNWVNASRTKLSPTPCIDVLTNLMLHVSLIDLGYQSKIRTDNLLSQIPVGDELRKTVEISVSHFSRLVYQKR